MEIDLIVSKKYIDEEYIRNKTVVVIDMLRATSVMVTALSNGAKNIIAVTKVEEAFERARYINEERLDSNLCILGGERNALKINGFNCSNSPLEYTESVVSGKTVIMTTSNGTAAINKSLTASNIIIGAMLNGRAVAEKCVNIGQDVIIINAGTNDEFSMDDFICGGYIISEIMNKTDKCNLTDIAMASVDAYEYHPDIGSYICRAKHYNILQNLGLEADIKYCMQKSITEVVPFFKGEYIVK